jgi:hypothetical protein
MNNPSYIVVDEMKAIVAATGLKLGKSLNYLYGYVTELTETLQQWSDVQTLYDKKYPLVWLAQPFTIMQGKQIGIYGEIEELRLFIITDSDKTYKAEQRMTINYKPTLYPIMAELEVQISKSKAFQSYQNKLGVKFTDRYYWGEQQRSVLNDVVDIIEMKITGIKIQNNLNC